MDLEVITQILIIIGIDLVLGGDNAIVIALACRNLPMSKRNKAIFFGTILAIIMRILLTIMAVYLLMIPYLQLLGGVLLIWIAYKLLIGASDDPSKVQGGTTLYQAVKTIVIADIVMGFDNVLAVAGAAEGKVVLVMFGLLVSIPIIIWGSKIILYYMERFPIIIYIGSAILAYTAGSMIVNEEGLQPLLEGYSYSHYFIPLITIAIVLTFGLLRKSTITSSWNS